MGEGTWQNNSVTSGEGGLLNKFSSFLQLRK